MRKLIFLLTIFVFNNVNAQTLTQLLEYQGAGSYRYFEQKVGESFVLTFSFKDSVIVHNKKYIGTINPDIENLWIGYFHSFDSLMFQTQISYIKNQSVWSYPLAYQHPSNLFFICIHEANRVFYKGSTIGGSAPFFMKNNFMLAFDSTLELKWVRNFMESEQHYPPHYPVPNLVNFAEQDTSLAIHPVPLIYKAGMPSKISLLQDSNFYYRSTDIYNFLRDTAKQNTHVNAGYYLLNTNGTFRDFLRHDVIRTDSDFAMSGVLPGPRIFASTKNGLSFSTLSGNSDNCLSNDSTWKVALFDATNQKCYLKNLPLHLIDANMVFGLDLTNQGFGHYTATIGLHKPRNFSLAPFGLNQNFSDSSWLSNRNDSLLDLLTLIYDDKLNLIDYWSNLAIKLNDDFFNRINVFKPSHLVPPLIKEQDFKISGLIGAGNLYFLNNFNTIDSLVRDRLDFNFLINNRGKQFFNFKPFKFIQHVLKFPKGFALSTGQGPITTAQLVDYSLIDNLRQEVLMKPNFNYLLRYEFFPVSTTNLSTQPITAKLYPNPSRGMFVLEDLPTNAQIIIYNLQGQAVHQVANHHQERLTINHNLFAGLYFVSINHPKGRQTLKLVIN